MSDVGVVFVLVTGAAPGLGKSTLVRRLADHLAGNDLEVVPFLEDEIGERDEFDDVMASFRSTGAASAAALVDATRRLAATYRGRPSTVVVQDMLIPYLPSLFAWGFSDAEIEQLLAEIDAACAGIRLIQIHLDGSPSLSIPRAVVREDATWLDWMIGKVSRYAGVTTPITDLPSLIEHFDGARLRTMRLLTAARWPVVLVDVDAGHDVATARAIDELSAFLG